MRKWRVLVAGFEARIEDTRLPKCVMFGELVGGTVSSGEHEKEWMGCLLDDLRAFGIKIGQWTIAAQDENKGRGGNLQAELDRGRWSQDCTTACSSVSERDRKNQRKGSTK